MPSPPRWTISPTPCCAARSARSCPGSWGTDESSRRNPRVSGRGGACPRKAARDESEPEPEAPMPESIPAPLIIDTLKDTFREARAALAKEGWPQRHDHIGWILSVPDTHQKTVLPALDKEQSIKVLTCSKEDEAVTINAGLHIGGEPVVLMIQHAGLYACVNTLRGVAMDGKVPAFYMIGLLSREKDKDLKESRHSMVRFCEPLLDTFSVPHARLEGPDDVHRIPEYYRLSRERKGPTAVLVGLETI